MALQEEFSAKGIPCRACFRPSVVIMQAGCSPAPPNSPHPKPTLPHTHTHTYTPNLSPASRVPVQVTCPDRTAAAALASRPELIPASAAGSRVGRPRRGLSCCDLRPRARLLPGCPP